MGVVEPRSKKAGAPAKGDARHAPKPGRRPEPPRGKGAPPQASAPAKKRAHPRPLPPKPKPKPAPPSSDGPKRSGRVALVGRPNVGKSTLLNAALGTRLAAVSPTPQTTREALLGVLHHGSAEIALLDTPGLHKPKTELGRLMNHAAREAAREADVVVVVVEVPETHGEPTRTPKLLSPHPADLSLVKDLGGAGDAPTAARAVLVVNKVDRVRDKARLLPLIEAYARLHDFAAIVPISALRESGVRVVLDEIAQLLPERAWEFDEDTLTDKPTRFFAGEYVREQILLATSREVPHAAAVTIDDFVEPANPKAAVRVDATILVERPGQKRIMIGAGGEMLKRIGTAARARIEELVGRQILLKLWVKVEPDWREQRRLLDELGLAGAASDGAKLAAHDAATEAAEEEEEEEEEGEEDE
ncbi:MAG TPA: GTPase Era [Byssovorax sp.]